MTTGVAVGVGAGAGRAGALPAQAMSPSTAHSVAKAVAKEDDEAGENDGNNEVDVDGATDTMGKAAETGGTREVDATDATEDAGEIDGDSAFAVTDGTTGCARTLVICRRRNTPARCRRCAQVGAVHLSYRNTLRACRIPWV